jgi:hypothetical protein
VQSRAWSCGSNSFELEPATASNWNQSGKGLAVGSGVNPAYLLKSGLKVQTTEKRNREEKYN